MNVVLAVVGVVIVDDKLDVVHIQPPGSHVGGDKQTPGEPIRVSTVVT